MRWIICLLCLLCAPAWAQSALSGTDKLGRHYSVTVTGKPGWKALPKQQDMVAVNYDVARFVVGECPPDKAVTRCDFYAAPGQEGINAPGYLIGESGPTYNGVTYFEFIGIPSGKEFRKLTCVAAKPAPLSGPGIVEGRGPIILTRAGADLRESYDKRFGCGITLNETAVLIGSVTFTGGS